MPAITALVVIVNTGDTVAPAATVTDGGGAATDVLLLDSITTAPPDGAGALSVTVFRVVGFPPWIALGESVKAVTTGPDGGFTTRFAITVLPP